MAQKLITALQAISSVTDNVNFPGDDTIQTYRFPAVKLKEYVLAPGNIVKNMLASVVQEALVPAGSIIAFGSATAPSGYLVCDGSAVSRTTYADLFAAIGTSHGNGNGTTTFNLPDLRGRFIRGFDNGAGRDPDAAGRTASNTGGLTGSNVGTLQGHAFQTHTHTQTAHGHSTQTGGVGSAARPNGVANDLLYGGTGSTNWGITAVATTAVNQNATASGTHAQASANETRPVNVSEQFIIKY